LKRELTYNNDIHAVVEVGLIIDQEAIFDEQGNMLTEPTYREDYHFDIMAEKEIAFGVNEITTNSPKHTFAGY
jgi:translation elongation factor EF-1beta